MYVHRSCCQAELPDFYLFHLPNPKTGEIYKSDTKLPNGHKIYQICILQMTIEYTNFFLLPRPSKIFPNVDFGLKTYHLATLLSRIKARKPTTLLHSFRHLLNIVLQPT
jgi:hypothetical protein